MPQERILEAYVYWKSVRERSRFRKGGRCHFIGVGRRSRWEQDKEVLIALENHRQKLGASLNCKSQFNIMAYVSRKRV